MKKEYHYLMPITALFVTALLVSNIASTKLTDIGWLVLDAGTFLFPLTYIFGDVLTEVYGFKVARRVIWIGFGCTALASLTFIIVGMLPPAADWPYQESYEAILGLTPRIVLASLIAYLFGEFSNSMILAKMKVAMKGRYLWMRTIGSTLVGQLLDSVIFIFIAFLGVFPMSVLLALILSNYVFKVGVEILFTPVTYRMVAFLKKKDAVDAYDRDTSFVWW